MATSKAEARIARVVASSIEEALVEMESVVLRYLAEGRKIDAKMMNQLAAELQRLAAEYGHEIVINGELGKLMTAQRIAGAKAGGAGESWLRINSEALAVALQNDKVKIAGLLGKNADTINEIIAGARVSGKSRAEVVREIMARVKTEKAITAARAETIYRAETFSGYRQFSHAQAVADGIEYFMQQGVADDRTAAICLQHQGDIKTGEEWEKFEPLVWQYGLHYKCRCDWAPVVNPEAQRIIERAELYRSKAKAELKDRREEEAAKKRKAA